LATVPSLLKMLFGIETAFTRSFWGLLNTTFVATSGALTYLCLDTLVKAVYLLRCFYGESLHTGEDLRAELKPLLSGASGAAVRSILLIFLASVTPLNAVAAPENPPYVVPVAPSGIAPSDLDRSIEQVLKQPRYNW